MTDEDESAGKRELRVLESTGPQGIAACFPVIRELREALDQATYEARLAEAMAQGYRLARAEHASDRVVEVVGVIGYRPWNDLVFGRSLFVDDLVVVEGCRGGGIGGALLRHVEAVARRQGCAVLRLSSGLWRENAHRFYQNLDFTKRGFAFVKPLGE